MTGLSTLRACLLGTSCLLAASAAHADTYNYDELGNVRQIQNDKGVRTYTFDEVNRLKTESGLAGVRTHTYDPNSNRLNDGAPSPTTASFAPASDRIATLNGVTVTLDAAGNLLGDGTYTYAWNDAGQLLSVSKAGQLVAKYYYDYKGRRTRKATTAIAPQGAQVFVYHYDASDHLIGETLGDATPLRTYVWLNDQPNAVIEHPALSTPQRTLYLQVDHLGTPRLAKDSTGKIQWRWDSDGYGSTAADEDPDGDGKKTTINLRFAGQYYDVESGLHYNWNRYYSPRLGRYISSDPIGVEGGGNTYGYVGGTPLSYFDVLGLSPMSPTEIAQIIKDNNHSPLSNEMVMCLMWQESGFDPDVENDGARGLMQIRKNQALAQVNKKSGPFAWQDLFDPSTNTEVGTLYLNWVSQRPGDLDRNIQRRYGTGDDYPVAKMRQCEKCLQETCSKDGDVKKCLAKVHR